MKNNEMDWSSEGLKNVVEVGKWEDKSSLEEGPVKTSKKRLITPGISSHII